MMTNNYKKSGILALSRIYLAVLIFLLLILLSIVIILINNFSLQQSRPSVEQTQPTLGPIKPTLMRTRPSIEQSNFKSVCEKSLGTWLGQYQECESEASNLGLTKEQCELLGGQFNGCESACRHQKLNQGVMCIQICVKVCKF